ncbi:CCR4-associated factor 16, putative (CAF16) [Plasmodium ovale curtisi]|uniref:CCR4-associated factor 16, putative (CAF16) n=1 Tax=Plasmodium ovale curtisi TaxID=864141 RepID=A0A1A8X194_PLAOA|nr:CCR4-associated factor 16, putative (CAF16) [Plasmodium ovale curtisi]SBS97454.1 CCR4-associated factor 16, putative (CAF16) [Plasmodium ovale curtisi]
MFNKPVFHDTTLAGRIGFVGEWWSNDYAMNITIRELFSEYHGSRRYTHLLKLFDMDENKLISGISKGEKKKVQIMVNIIKRKDIYIFDEATESLDLISRKLLLDRFLRKESEKHNCIIIYSTHIFDYIQGWCSHILYLSSGSVAFFSDIGIITSAKNYVSLADHIFENMMRETREKEKEKEKGLSLDGTRAQKISDMWTGTKLDERKIYFENKKKREPSYGLQKKG